MRPVSTHGSDATAKLWIQLHAQAVANFMGIGNSDPCVLAGQYIGESSNAYSILDTNNELKYVYYVVKLMLAVTHRCKNIAADIICNKLSKVMAEFPVTLYHVMVTFFGALAIIDKNEKTKKDLDLLNNFSRDLKDWSKTNPSMFMHKWLLVQAETCRLDLTNCNSQSSASSDPDFFDKTDSPNDTRTNDTTGFAKNSKKCDYTSIMVLDLYEEAITLAINEGFIQDAAIINERCGDFLQQHSKKKSLAFFKEAVRLYTIWGARPRAKQILAKIPDLEYSFYGMPNSNNVNSSIADLSDISKSSNSVGVASSSNIYFDGPSSIPFYSTTSSNNLSTSLNTSISENTFFNSLGSMGSSNALNGLNPKEKLESQLLKNLTLRQEQLSTTVSSSPLRWILSNLFREDRAEGNSISGTDKEKKLSVDAHSEHGMLGPAIPVANQRISSGVSSVPSYEPYPGDLELKTALQYCLDISEAIEVDSVLVKFVNSVMKSSGADYCVFVTLDKDEPYIDAIGILNGVRLYNHEPMSSRADVPLSVVYQVVSSGQLLSKDSDPAQFELVYGRDSYFQTRHSQSVLCMPIQNQLKTVGAVYIEHQSLANIFTQPRIELLGLLCTQVVMSLEKAKLYHQMEVAKRAAEEATEEKASFLANMSHEIRTPFNALLSCSIFLLDTRLSDVQREYVEIIRSSAMLTLNIIDAILAFSKIEHGSITLENSPFSLRECVESAIQLVAEPAAKKELELVHLNRCGEIDIIYGDVTRVRQIIINLVGNAVKFTSKGHILVETHAEQVSSDNRYEFVITVKDTGIGIPKSARNKVFRAFSQVDGSSRRVYGGSGLGLAISKKLAELMGGNLSFESDGEYKEGTTFWFDLVAFAKKWQDDETEELKQKYQHKRVLVVDHLEKTMESLVVELERIGFVVETCLNVTEAVARVNKSLQDADVNNVENVDAVLLENKQEDTKQDLKWSGLPKPDSLGFRSRERVSPNLSSSSLSSSGSAVLKPTTIQPNELKYSLVFIDGKLLTSDCNELQPVKALSPTTQYIFMTTFGASIPENAKEKGISAVLMRPIQRNKLVSIIEAVVDPLKHLADCDEMDGLGYGSAAAISAIEEYDETGCIKKTTGEAGVIDAEAGFPMDGDDTKNSHKQEICCEHDCTNPNRQKPCPGSFHLESNGLGDTAFGKKKEDGVGSNRQGNPDSIASLTAKARKRPLLASKYPLKILLAEDNPINTRVALQHLKRMGYDADHAKDGVEVLKMCQREQESDRPMYDCILMDIQMPNKDGIAAAQELMELYKSNERPEVIALTANAAGEDRQRCLSVGMSNYIAKPILPADLADVLRGVEPLIKRQYSQDE